MSSSEPTAKEVWLEAYKGAIQHSGTAWSAGQEANSAVQTFNQCFPPGPPTQTTTAADTQSINELREAVRTLELKVVASAQLPTDLVALRMEVESLKATEIKKLRLDVDAIKKEESAPAKKSYLSIDDFPLGKRIHFTKYDGDLIDSTPTVLGYHLTGSSKHVLLGWKTGERTMKSVSDIGVIIGSSYNAPTTSIPDWKQYSVVKWLLPSDKAASAFEFEVLPDTIQQQGQPPNKPLKLENADQAKPGDRVRFYVNEYKQYTNTPTQWVMEATVLSKHAKHSWMNLGWLPDENLPGFATAGLINHTEDRQVISNANRYTTNIHVGESFRCEIIRHPDNQTVAELQQVLKDKDAEIKQLNTSFEGLKREAQRLKQELTEANSNLANTKCDLIRAKLDLVAAQEAKAKIEKQAKPRGKKPMVGERLHFTKWLNSYVDFRATVIAQADSTHLMLGSDEPLPGHIQAHKPNKGTLNYLSQTNLKLAGAEDYAWHRVILDDHLQESCVYETVRNLTLNATIPINQAKLGDKVRFLEGMNGGVGEATVVAIGHEYSWVQLGWLENETTPTFASEDPPGELTNYASKIAYWDRYVSHHSVAGVFKVEVIASSNETKQGIANEIVEETKPVAEAPPALQEEATETAESSEKTPQTPETVEQVRPGETAPGESSALGTVALAVGTMLGAMIGSLDKPAPQTQAARVKAPASMSDDIPSEVLAAALEQSQ